MIRTKWYQDQNGMWWVHAWQDLGPHHVEIRHAVTTLTSDAPPVAFKVEENEAVSKLENYIARGTGRPQAAPITWNPDAAA